MGKRPKSKKNLSDRVRNKTFGNKRDLSDAVRRNPFEIKVNKQKHKVIGKKLTKYDKGIPGVSRSKAIKKRQETLLLEYQNKRKSNKLIDNRIGEKDNLLSSHEKMTRRFAAEHKKQFGAGKYNLDGDEDEEGAVELTHMGQSLSEIERFDRPASYSDEDEDNPGTLSSDLVRETHFGGGILQTKGQEEGGEKSWRDKMDEMIAKSKLAKHERQAEQDELAQLTERLDGQWRNLHNVVASIRRRDDDEDNQTVGAGKKRDDYDMAVNRLRFESRGSPSERLKTEEELAQEEAERLEKLERERLARMRGDNLKSTRPHQSADDLDDGMDYGMDDEEEFVALYKDGRLVTPMKADTDSEADEEDAASSDTGSDSGEEDESEDGDGEDDEGEDDEGDYSDLDSDPEATSDADFEVVDSSSTANKVATNSSEAKQKADIPFTFNIPGSYTLFIELIDKYSLADQNTVVERMRKCNHPSLSANNKQHLVRLFGFLCEYFGDIALRVPVAICLLDQLTVHLYEMAKQSPRDTSRLSRQLVLDRHNVFSEYCKTKNGKAAWPFLDLMMYFKLISALYPTSDYRHDVVTPMMLFASQIYVSCPVTNHRDVAVSLLLTTVMCEYVSFSKCLMPETVNLLSALLLSASPSNQSRVTVATAVVRSNLLVCKADPEELRQKEILAFNLNQVIARGVGNSIYNTDDFRLTALLTTSLLLRQFLEKYKPLPASAVLFSSARHALHSIDASIYPGRLQAVLIEVNELLDSLKCTSLEYVCRERRKPKVLKTYEPEIDAEFYAGGKKTTGDKVADEKQKLKHKYKKELKAAVREVKKDSAFIAAQNIKEKIKRDSERQKKTNKILADLQGQQHEINMFHKMNRKPRRKK